MNYLETVNYLYQNLPMFQRDGKSAYKENLDNIRALTKEKNNPETNFRTIHIAGTNGKGSVSHMLASVLQKAGHKTGLFTSPHLFDFRERIRIDGEMVPEQFIVTFIEENRRLIEHIKPSFFEMTALMAFDYFAKEKVDIAVIETGLGGRLDATNIIIPILSIITNISLDHTDILGNTITKIAYEKAGIIKEGVPVVIGESCAGSEDVFRQCASENNSNILFADKLYSVTSFYAIDNKQMIKIIDKRNNSSENYQLDLLGDYQQKNVCTVLCAINELIALGIQIEKRNILDGLSCAASTTGLKGRWQILNKDPLIVADTAHNEAGLMNTMQQLQKYDYKKLHIVFGMVVDKDISKVLALMPKDAKYYFTKADLPRSMNEKQLQLLAFNYQLNGNDYENVSLACEAALKSSKSGDMIYVGGSTFVVAEAIPFFNTMK